jgi:hypothetical protein
VRNAVINLFAARAPTQYSLAGLETFGANALGAWVYQAQSGTGISLGIRLSAESASRAGLGIHFTVHDWALALSSEFITARIADVLRTRLGPTLPPPLGPAPVVLAEQQVCVLPAPWPLQGCVQQATQRVFLDVLTVTFTQQGILLTGAVRQVTDAWFVPVVSASWSTLLTLSLGAQGALAISFSDPQVQVSEWYAVVANAISGGAIANLVRDGIANALTSGNNAQITASLGEFVREAVSAGRVIGANLQLAPTSVEHRAGGVIVHGNVLVNSTLPSPVAFFREIPGRVPGTLIFNAAESWAPGAEILEYQWTFGDGQSASFTGAQRKIAVEHTYAAGRYTCCLTIRDSLGRTAQHCVAVSPGMLDLKHVPDGGVPWQFCETAGFQQLTFSVASSGSPASGCTVSAEGNGWSVQGVTGSLGVVTLSVDQQKVRAMGFVVPSLNRHVVGSIRVTALRPGYATATGIVRMIDCSARASTIEDATRHREEILDRLAGYSFLERLRESGALGRPPIDVNPFERAALDIGAAVDILTRLEILLDAGGRGDFAADVLGLDRGGSADPAQVRDRIDQLWDGVAREAQRLEEHFKRGRGPPYP